MRFRPFGRTGIEISCLSLGTASFGKQTEEAAALRIIDMAVEAGVNFIDTADMYPMGASYSEMGQSEEILGPVAQSRASFGFGGY